jgi:acetolactate synthase-1/2/3 large subunit
MNGAESLVHTLLASGIDTVFANPGTSEMHFVAALDRIPGMHCVLCLSEGVVTGAADAYWRVSGKPAATLLHCGPGLANGLANLHNAMRANSGVVNIVGDQATHHRPLDAPLTADVEGWARPISAFVRRATTAARVGADAAAAIEAARTYPGQISTLILPADTAWNDGGVANTATEPVKPAPCSSHMLDTVARILRSGEKTLLILGNTVLGEAALLDAYRIARHCNAGIFAPRAPARLARGRGRPPILRIPYPIDTALEAFAGVKNLILVGSPEPVSFFAYPGKPGRLYPEDCKVHVLARTDEDGPASLAALADALRAPRIPAPDPGLRPLPATGATTPERFAQSLAALMPDNSIIIDEAISFGRGFFPETYAAPPHDWMQLTGGGIGDGIPMSVGAAIAAPDRRVITLQGDGSAMYTVAGLWTQARERLNITTIILSNRQYAILRGELAGVGANPGPTAFSMLDLSNPDLDWPKIANGMGVEAARAETLEELNGLLASAVGKSGPFLIEMVL